ncbi:arrestin, beta 2b isoform X1 [Syngnathus acus]|uniref:arrestin, beta 2b isoform X1 n=1 Tax=Syngnathus acus TaxID=161584 RepID=UPI001885B94E|nr:arrestin, beta 2b isoform X1 [Syngnathus acus]
MGDKEGTRVFKKISPNGKLSVYLGKRVYVDHFDHVDPVDGVILVDPEYLQDRKVFVTLTCVFRYGREESDVLGLPYRKDLYISLVQAFPRVADQKPLSVLQEKLLRKLGQHAHPFCFNVRLLSRVTSSCFLGRSLMGCRVQIPPNLPCSVTLQPAHDDVGKACGVDFEIQAYCAKSVSEKILQRNAVELVIRKVQYAPEKKGPQPSAESTRSFLLSERPLHLEASLDKELYYHGEPINVNVHVSNNSSKTVKKVKIAVRQYTDVWIFFKDQFKCPVAQLEVDEQVCASSTFCQVYTLTPSMGDNRHKQGLAMDGDLNHHNTNLASSTIMNEGCNKETLGIMVSYRVKVKLVVSRGGDMAVELPFFLMHPKPSDQKPAVPQAGAATGTDLDNDPSPEADDLVFQDFGRLDLEGDEDDPLC